MELNKEKTRLRTTKVENLPEFKPKKKSKADDGKEPTVNPYENLEV